MNGSMNSGPARDNFKTGDRVRYIIPNPDYGVTGTVIAPADDTSVHVEWDDGKGTVTARSDIEKIGGRDAL